MSQEIPFIFVNIVRIGRFEPSSKTCSNCGWIKSDLTLDIREWECKSCHAKHDRDINAAKNILQMGLRDQMFLVGVVRPELKLLENTLSGQPLVDCTKRVSMKEETQPSLVVR